MNHPRRDRHMDVTILLGSSSDMPVAEKCTKILNEFFNTKEAIENHECGKDHLKKRKDDNYKTIATRYDVYMERTKPVLDFYSSLSYFHEIDGSQKIEVITSKIEHILNL